MFLQKSSGHAVDEFVFLSSFNEEWKRRCTSGDQTNSQSRWSEGVRSFDSPATPSRAPSTYRIAANCSDGLQSGKLKFALTLCAATEPADIDKISINFSPFVPPAKSFFSLPM
jgi:hypothetical protein